MTGILLQGAVTYATLGGIAVVWGEVSVKIRSRLRKEVTRSFLTARSAILGA
jgi:hypothetical protein